MEFREILVIVHLFGTVMGAGGAIASDFMFFKSMKDMKISKLEMDFLNLGSRMVWIGLVILVTSGGLLFQLDVAKYLDSPKFLAKMTIVGIIILNGMLLHTEFIPMLRRHLGKKLPYSPEFEKWKPFLFASGAISITSWMSALVLGSLRKSPFTYWEIMLVYGGVIFMGVMVSIFVLERKLKKV